MAAAGGASGTPITASKVLSLSALGVQGKAINVKTTSMTSHKAILIREDNGGKGQLSTVDPSEQRIKSKHALEGDAACQSPNGKLLAARGETSLGIVSATCCAHDLLGCVAVTHPVDVHANRTAICYRPPSN